MNRERRLRIRGVGGVLLGLALLATPMASASLAEAGGKPGSRGKQVKHRDKVVRVQQDAPRAKGKTVRVQDAPRASGKPVLVRPGRVVVAPPPVVRRRPVPAPVYRRPIVVRRPAVVRVAPMWAVGAPYFWVGSTPYYFNAGLGIYLGGVSLAFQFTNAPPPGYVYYDAYCGYQFVSVAAYRNHLCYASHPHALQVVPVDVCGY